MPFQIIEELATAGGHLQEPAARVEILAVRAQVLGQVIDASGEQCNLDFRRTGILLVSFVFCDDFGFNDCGRHGLWLVSRLKGGFAATVAPASPDWKSG
jgi:hypothetical protein